MFPIEFQDRVRKAYPKLSQKTFITANRGSDRPIQCRLGWTRDGVTLSEAEDAHAVVFVCDGGCLADTPLDEAQRLVLGAFDREASLCGDK